MFLVCVESLSVTFLMCSGSSWHVLCMSVCRIMLLSVVIAVCGLVIFSFLKAASVSSVNLIKFAFLSV